MDPFVDACNLRRVKQEDAENLNRPVPATEIEAAIKTVPGPPSDSRPLGNVRFRQRHCTARVCDEREPRNCTSSSSHIRTSTRTPPSWRSVTFTATGMNLCSARGGCEEGLGPSGRGPHPQRCARPARGGGRGWCHPGLCSPSHGCCPAQGAGGAVGWGAGRPGREATQGEAECDASSSHAQPGCRGLSLTLREVTTPSRALGTTAR